VLVEVQEQIVTEAVWPMVHALPTLRDAKFALRYPTIARAKRPDDRGFGAPAPG
jgi:hypothetical protein